jgi:hypothetical protein
LHLIPSLEPEIEALARLIVPHDAGPACYEAARGVAEAQIDLRRVKAARSLLLDAQDDTREVAEMIGDLARDLLRLDRYEQTQLLDAGVQNEANRGCVRRGGAHVLLCRSATPRP